MEEQARGSGSRILGISGQLSHLRQAQENMDWPVLTGFSIKEVSAKKGMQGRFQWVREPVVRKEKKQLFPINQGDNS